jgi:hypothetical protein
MTPIPPTGSKSTRIVNESEIRLAELIWRTVKLRVSLLIITIVVLLVVWSSLLNGNQEARKIDAQFCGQLTESHNAAQIKFADAFNKFASSKPGVTKLTPFLWSSEEYCASGQSRTWIEIVRHTDETLFVATQISSPVPYLGLLGKTTKDEEKSFADYDAQRQAAYRLQIQLSSEYSGSTIIVNALTVARVVPFCVFLVLELVVILGFQQSAYRKQLQGLLRSRTDDDLPEVMAETQFFAAPLERDPSRPEKYLAASPVHLAIGTLSVAAISLLVGIVSTSLLTFVQLTDTFIMGYPFALYAALVVLAVIAVITQRAYSEFSQSKPEHLKLDHNSQASTDFRWLTMTSALVACVSLAFPWATCSVEDGLFRGYQFLLNQRAMGESFKLLQFGLSPQLFRDVRIQVTIAMAFLAVCVLDALWGMRQTSQLIRMLHQVRRLLAFCVFALSIYTIMYILFLGYEAVFSVPWLDKLGYLGPRGSRGHSLLEYDPAYGFVLFLLCCLFLVWLSFTNGTARPGAWARRIDDAASLKWKTLVEFYRSKQQKSIT